MADNPYEPLGGSLQDEPRLGATTFGNQVSTEPSKRQRASDVIASLPEAAPVDPTTKARPTVAEVLAKIPHEDTERLRAMYRSLREEPDTASKIDRLSRHTGLDPTIVRRRLGDVERLDAEPDWEATRKLSPRLTRILAGDPVLFESSVDDITALSTLERLTAWQVTGVLGPLLGLGENRVLDQRDLALQSIGGATIQGGAFIPRLLQDLTSPEIQEGGFAGTFETPGGTPQGFRARPQATVVPGQEGTTRDAANTFFREAADAISEIGQIAREDIPESARRELAEPFVVRDEEGNFEGLHFTPSVVVSTLSGSLGYVPWMYGGAGLLRALGAGPIFAGALSNATVISGETYNETYERTLADLTESGLDHDLARDQALEKAQVARNIMFPVALFTGAMGEGTALGAMSRPRGVLRAAGMGAASEALEEPIQTALPALVNNEAPDIDELITAGVLAPLMGGVQGATVAAFAVEQTRAMKAGDYRNRLAELEEVASQSKLRERDPEKFERVMEGLVPEGGKDLYLDANDFVEYFQEQGVDPMEIAAQLTGVAAQLPGAVQRGGDLRIRASEFVTRLGATEHAQALNDLVRPEPQAMSAKEAEEWQANQQERFQELVEQVDRERAADEEWQASVQQVEQFVTEQIVQSGRFTEEVARKDAALHGAMAKVLATKLGVQPHQVYERFGLRVQGEPEAEGQEVTFGQETLGQVQQVREAQQARAQREQAIDETLVEDQVFVEDLDQVVPVQRPAREALTEARERRDKLQRFVECLNG